MLKIKNITKEPHQSHIIITDTGEIELALRYLPPVQIWIMDVTYKNRSAYGMKISGKSGHFRGFNFPFDFVCQVTDDSGLDPFKSNDFEIGRCELYLVTRSEMAELRGTDVE